MRNLKVILKKLLIVLFVGFSMSGYGQQISVTGQVLDEKTQEPLIGVSVKTKDGKTGTITDIDGHFTVTAESKQVLVFSYIGFEDIELEAAPSMQVFLKVDSKTLDEVVVVGYGTQKKASSVAAISTTKGEDLMKVGNLNTLSEALQGKLNGVIAINTNSKPGDNAASIYIRGKASWNGTDPLILVDGIERNMNDIDMNEIESISVLKDASATAVYGVRGANGVILVTTKRGSNKAPTVNFSANFGLKQPTATLKYADYVTSMKMFNEAAANDKNWTKLIPQSTISAWENAYATGNYGPYNDYFPQVDWYDEVMKDYGTSQNYNINVNGGTDRMAYFASIGYQYDGDIYNIQKQDDFDPRFWYKRYNWRSNFDFNLTKYTKFSINIAGKMGYRNQTSGDEMFTAILQTPTNMFPIKYSDGYWGEAEQMGFNIVSNINTRGQLMYKTFQGWYDATLKQDLDFFVKGLSVQGKLSYNSSSSTNSRVVTGQIYGNNDFESQSSVIRFNRKYDYANPVYNEDGTITYPLLLETRFPDLQAVELPVGVSYDNFGGYGRKLYYEFAVNFDRSFGGHNVTAMALMNRQITESNNNSVMNFPSYSEDWVGRATYNWKGRYLAEVNMAYTGSEKFAPGKRFGFFPSYSLGWRISEEPFIKERMQNVLTNLKIRYSYGQVGSDAGALRFNYIQVYNSGGTINFGQTVNVAQGPMYTEGATANPNATWEVATKQDLGLELGLWSKLKLEMDLYQENRTGILMTPRTMAAWFGAGLPSVNIGETKNHGIEMELNWNDHIGKDFRYWSTFSFAASENRIVFRDDPGGLDPHLKDAGKPIDYQNRFLAVGNYGSIDDIFNYSQTAISGITPAGLTPGDLVYIDFNGDGLLNADDKVVVPQGNYPLTTFGFSLGFEYKGFAISSLWYAPIGIYKLQFDQFLFDFPNSNVKVQSNALDRWTEETANSTGVIRPAIHLNKNHNWVESTYKYSDYSYLRLKNVEISYTIPKKITKVVNISNCKVFANGNNLLTFWKGDSRVDPETGGSGSYPIVKTYTIGVRLAF